MHNPDLVPVTVGDTKFMGADLSSQPRGCQAQLVFGAGQGVEGVKGVTSLLEAKWCMSDC